MREFFVLNAPENLPDNQYVEYVDGKIEYALSIKCSKSIGHTRGGSRISKLFVNVSNCCDDMLWTWYSDCLIDNKVVEVLKGHKISGYRLEKIVVVKDKRKNDKPELKELVVVGKGGHIHPMSGYKILEVCDNCGNEKIQHAKSGLIVDETQWDQTDIFVLDEYPKIIIVTERVMDLIKRSKIKGCSFKLASNYVPLG